MADRFEYEIMETRDGGWAVKRIEITTIQTGSDRMVMLQSEHATQGEAQAEADRLNASSNR